MTKAITFPRMIFLVFFLLIYGLGKAQTAKFYLQISNEERGVPVISDNASQGLATQFSDTLVDSVFKKYRLYQFKKAFPTARSPFLKTMYEIEANDMNLMIELTESFNDIYPFGERIEKPLLLSYTPDDYGLSYGQSYLDLIRAEEAWGITTGSSDIVIGITDTEFDLNHEDLSSQIVQSHGSNSSWVHGTRVAGCVAAATDNGVGTPPALSCP